MSGIDCANIGPMLLKFTPSCTKTNDEYYEPWGVAADPDGLYVVSDHHNHHIQVRFCTVTELIKAKSHSELRICRTINQEEKVTSTTVHCYYYYYFLLSRFMTPVVAFCTSSATGVKQTGRSGTQRACVWAKVDKFT